MDSAGCICRFICIYVAIVIKKKGSQICEGARKRYGKGRKGKDGEEGRL